MKKALILFMILLTCLSVFGKETKSETMNIRGYYNSSSSSSSISFTITESVSGNNKSLLSTYANLTDDYTNSAKEAFAWTFSGTIKNNVSVSFTFLPLQALLNGYYYQPQYTVAMTLNNTKVGTDEVSNDGFRLDSKSSSSFSKSLETRDASVYINGFNSENTISYAGQGNKNWSGTWTRSGSCSFYIQDYEKYIAGDFDYTCNVTVTFTTN